MADPQMPDHRFPTSRRAKAGTRAAGRRRPAEQNRHWFDGAYGTLVLLLGLLAIARLAVGGTMPPVAEPGDRIIFGVLDRPAPDAPVIGHKVAGTWAAAGDACTLNPAVMAARPGALTVLAARPDGVLVSWAGGRTTAGAGGCAGGATILLTDMDYLRLRDSQAPKR